MTNTTTTSGQRPPNATRPTDAELARLLRRVSNWLNEFAVEREGDRSSHAIFKAMRDADEAADALDAAPARLTPEQWQEAVERATRAAGNVTKPRTLALSDKILRAAFPHLAPNPED